MSRKLSLIAVLALASCIEQGAIANSVAFNPDQDVNTPSPSTQSNAAEQTDISDPHVIKNHGGGRILVAEARRRALLNWGGPVRIEGYCKSSCVIFTTLPNACIEAGTEIGFHSSSVNFGPVGNAQISRYLRNGIKARYLEAWQFVPTDKMHNITAERFVRLDPEAQLCAEN